MQLFHRTLYIHKSQITHKLEIAILLKIKYPTPCACYEVKSPLNPSSLHGIMWGFDFQFFMKIVPLIFAYVQTVKFPTPRAKSLVQKRENPPSFPQRVPRGDSGANN